MTVSLPDPVEPENLQIAIEAAYETEALCLRMIDMCGLDCLDFRGMAARMLALSRASMMALTDPDEDVERLRSHLGCERFGMTTGETLRHG